MPLWGALLAWTVATVATAQTPSLIQPAYPDLTFDRPLSYAYSSGSLGNVAYVVQQNGFIYAFPERDDASMEDRREFLNLSSRISGSGGETGLLGLAIPDDFQTTGHFFVYYTANDGGLVSRLSRFSLMEGSLYEADPQSELVILQTNQPQSNHNGGMIAFGPDGYLYIAMGDGGGTGDPGNNAQNRSNLLGSILRIDVSASTRENPYDVPDDNPFVGQEGVRPEIYAYGLRNPWRFSFDRETGQGWIGDVGQGSFEEINRLEAGANYGWRVTEGFACYNPAQGCSAEGFIMPVKVYGRSLGQSVTGGYVYRGAGSPQLAGAYIYGDYVSGRIWMLRREGGQTTADSLLIDTSLNIASFGERRDGELLILGYSNGRIYRFAPNLGTGIEEGGTDLPETFALGQNYPNPFNPSTEIPFDVAHETHVELSVYDLTGRKLATLVNGPYRAGSYKVSFNAGSLSSGIYFCVMSTPEGRLVRSMTLVR